MSLPGSIVSYGWLPRSPLPMSVVHNFNKRFGGAALRRRVDTRVDKAVLSTSLQLAITAFAYFKCVNAT